MIIELFSSILGGIFSFLNKQIPAPILPFLRFFTGGKMSFEQMVGHEPELALLNLIDTRCGDRQMPGLKAFHPTLSFEVPQVELNQFWRSLE
jgi:hypothetical protein